MSIKLKRETYEKLSISTKKILDLVNIPCDGEYYYFPDELKQEFKRFEPDYYDVGYFLVCGYLYNEEDVDINLIVGSADIELSDRKNWLEAIIYPRHFFASYNMATDNFSYYQNMCISQYEPISLYEKNGEYYVADGNHRINVLKLLLAMDYPGCSTKIRCRVKHLPNNRIFIEEFVKIVERYHLYDSATDFDGYITYTPHFEYLDNNYAYPTIRHIESGLIIKTLDDLQKLEEICKEKQGKKI